MTAADVDALGTPANTGTIERGDGARLGEDHAPDVGVQSDGEQRDQRCDRRQQVDVQRQAESGRDGEAKRRRQCGRYRGDRAKRERQRDEQDGGEIACVGLLALCEQQFRQCDDRQRQCDGDVEGVVADLAKRRDKPIHTHSL